MVLGLFNLCLSKRNHSTLLYFSLSPYLFGLHLSASILFLFLLLEQHIPLSISDGDAGWVIFALVQLFQRRSLFFFLPFSFWFMQHI